MDIVIVCLQQCSSQESSYNGGTDNKISRFVNLFDGEPVTRVPMEVSNSVDRMVTERERYKKKLETKNHPKIGSVRNYIQVIRIVLWQ